MDFRLTHCYTSFAAFQAVRSSAIQRLGNRATIVHREKKTLLQQVATRLVEKITYSLRRSIGRIKGAYSPARIPLVWPESPDRVELIQEFVRRLSVRSYLEIGCRDDRCFSQINVARRVGVDPVSGGTLRMTSDAFFADNRETFDLIFIDGLHHYEQVVRDIRNSLAVLNPGGVILVHDCLPLDAPAQYRAQCQMFWNGDVWKAFLEVRTWSEVDSALALIDQGIGIILPRLNTAPLQLHVDSFLSLTFDYLAADYQRLTRALSYEAAFGFVLSTRPAVG